MKHYLITGLFAAVLLGACSNDTYTGSDRAGSKLNVNGTISNTNAATRVTTNGLASTWEAGDSIGLYTIGNGTDYANAKYTTDGAGNFTAANGDIYLLSEGAVTLNAYYPYKGDAQLSDGNYPFSIKDDNNAYVKHDFLFASTSVVRSSDAETTASLQFSHKMNRLVLTVKIDDASINAKEGDAIVYTLQDVITDGVFNTTSGTISSETAAGDVVFSGKYGSPAEVIYIPQTKKNVELLIKLGTKYFSAIIPSLASSGTESGYSYTYNITKTAEGVTVQLDKVGINDWVAGEGGDIEAEEKNHETAGTPSVGDWNNGGNIDMESKN